MRARRRPHGRRAMRAMAALERRARRAAARAWGRVARQHRRPAAQRKRLGAAAAMVRATWGKTCG